MELPIELQMIINEYAKPLTRPDWKKGSYYNRMYYNPEYTFKEIIVLMTDEYDFTDDQDTENDILIQYIGGLFIY